MCSAECAIGTVCPIFLTAAHSLLSLVVTLVLLITAAVALGAAVGFGPAGATATANTTVALAAYGVVCSMLCTQWLARSAALGFPLTTLWAISLRGPTDSVRANRTRANGMHRSPHLRCAATTRAVEVLKAVCYCVPVVCTE